MKSMMKINPRLVNFNRSVVAEMAFGAEVKLQNIISVSEACPKAAPPREDRDGAPGHDEPMNRGRRPPSWNEAARTIRYASLRPVSLQIWS